MMFCPKCGKEIGDESSFCNNCGQNLNQTETVDAVPVNNNVNVGVDQRKSRLVAGLLQIFLGGLGIGRFYLGYTTIAILQIVVCIVTCGVGYIWPLVDGILIITGTPDVDANGVPLKE